MQRIYKVFFNKLLQVVGRWNEATRTVLLLCCCAVLMALFFFGGKSVYAIAKTGSSMVIGSIILVLMTICSVNCEMDKVKWSSLIYYPMVAFGIGIIVISFIHPVGAGYITFAIDLVVLFPAFYYVWINRGDFDKFYRCLSIAVMGNAFISYAYCFILAHKGTLAIKYGRVAAFTTNPNILGMLGVIILITSTYMLLSHSSSLLYVILYSLGTGIGISYCVIPASRTATLAMISIIVTAIIFVIKGLRIGEYNIGKILICLAIAVIASILLLQVSQQLDEINAASVERIVNAELQLSEGSDEGDEAAPENMKESAEPETTPETEPVPDLPEQDVKSLTDRMSSTTDFNAISSGRLGIWQIYVSHFSWLGEDIDSFVEELSLMPATRAHNNIIDYLCRLGYIVGTIYILFYMTCGLRCVLVLLNKNKAGAEDFLIVSSVGAYAVYALLEIAALSFQRCIPAMFFLLIGSTVGEKASN